MKNFIIQVLDLYMVVIIVRVFMSWIRVNQVSPFVKLIYKITEPVLAPVRSILPYMGGVDISPVIVFFVYKFLVRQLIINF